MNYDPRKNQRSSHNSKGGTAYLNEYHAMQFSEKTAYACDAPYPPVQVAERNPRNLQYILPYFAAPHGEFTALTQYSYQHWIVDAKLPELSRDLMGITKVEMLHFDIFGRLVILLGGDPKCAYLRNNRATPWNGFLLSYQKDPKQMLLMDIKAEQDTINSYLRMSQELKDPYLCAIFKRLALDEEVHLNLLRKHLNELG